ncbi:MAG: hypothetical protein IKN81_09565 [Oscillospiraceae bacterium]|nr:hypothetical protein [Oscillospiraceae bacterium]
MKRICCLFLVIGFLMVAFALPVAASVETAEAEQIEALEESDTLEEIEIEDEETPLAGLPGVGRADVARIIVAAGCCMIVAAGAILITGLRREHVRR